MQAGFLLYGATGYTGELMARAAIQRGLRPILAGRKTAALKKMADELSLTKQEIQAHFFIVNAGKIPYKWLTPATLRFMTACVTLPLPCVFVPLSLKGQDYESRREVSRVFPFGPDSYSNFLIDHSYLHYSS
jgi:short subunit dehydrogenase-like uncharacterized protein